MRAKALEGEGHKLLPSSVAAVRSDFLATVRALQETGLLKKQLI
jgi:hypothetical protein